MDIKLTSTAISQYQLIIDRRFSPFMLDGAAQTLGKLPVAESETPISPSPVPDPVYEAQGLVSGSDATGNVAFDEYQS
jgi:hypothetical protein